MQDDILDAGDTVDKVTFTPNACEVVLVLSAFSREGY